MNGLTPRGTHNLLLWLQKKDRETGHYMKPEEEGITSSWMSNEGGNQGRFSEGGGI